MYDQELLGEKLQQISDALARIARRFEDISSSDDFLDSNHGLDMLDRFTTSAAMIWNNFGRQSIV